VEELDDETRIKVTESGHELIISDLDYKDKGEYECSATNDITSVPVRGKSSLTPPLLIEEPVQSQESERSCICVLVVSILTVSMTF
jgi:hypothetical protein